MTIHAHTTMLHHYTHLLFAEGNNCPPLAFFNKYAGPKARRFWRIRFKFSPIGSLSKIVGWLIFTIVDKDVWRTNLLDT